MLYDACNQVFWLGPMSCAVPNDDVPSGMDQGDVSGTGHLASGTGCLALRMGHLTSGTGHLALGTGHLALGMGHQRSQNAF